MDQPRSGSPSPAASSEAPAGPAQSQRKAGSRARPGSWRSYLNGFEPGSGPLAITALILITGVWAYWAWRLGGFFGVVFYPGAIALLALLAVMCVRAPWGGRLARPAAIALGALVVLAGWTLASTLWSPARDIAFEDGARTLTYAVAFGLGMWLCHLARERILLAAIPLVLAGAAVAVGTAVVIGVGTDVFRYLEDDATLRFPLGYRNAAAAFFLIAFWPTLALASSERVDWRFRVALLMAATIELELAILAQSRGSAFAVIPALLVFVAASPNRLRTVAWLMLGLGATLPALPVLLDLYQHNGGNESGSIEPLRAAATAIAATTALSAVAGAVAVWAERRVRISPQRGRWLGRGLAALAAIGAIIGVVAVTSPEGGPIEFVNTRIDQLTSAGTPDFDEQGTRFGLNVGSNRGDFWRVSLNDARAEPLLGTGSGGFQLSYLLDRQSALTPDDPHSVEMLLLGELGVIGLALFALFCGAATVGAIRARSRGPAAATLTAGALAAGAYWLAHASIDWLWVYPAVTAPVLGLLGAACAPALLPSAAGGGRRARAAAATMATVVALGLLPPLFAERYTDEALRSWRYDLAGAYANLDRAQRLNPFSDRPALTEAVIAERTGEQKRSISAAREAQRRKPRFWGGYYLAARLLATRDPDAARAELRLARALNPESVEVKALAERLRERAGRNAG